MRLSDDQIDFLKGEILAIVPDAIIYLFGSRADNDKKGGDIDIMVLSANRLTWKDKATIRWSYFGRFGEQRLDIVSFDFNDETPFKEIVLAQGIRL
ncbi:MAG: nucleotidyltransferase domain-containing protein [Nitrospirae bacterium]|uniref:nucleotidyltransferase domain-containing protein n=1 Tax=Candidatus Magnetobacterium casense TaxID=1455061 RepID=UPI000591320A|nr:nucleotidyltransferase domain-containing protein [Candidatus Magnetobacterium casensis]MBF0336286.1 nucleotidyltransferase domain-containing protein [Nitrospirota bacterium]